MHDPADSVHKAESEHLIWNIHLTCFWWDSALNLLASATNNMAHSKVDRPEEPPAGFRAADGDL